MLTSDPALPPKLWAHAHSIEMLSHKDTPSRPGYVTISPNFIETEKVKQNNTE